MLKSPRRCFWSLVCLLLLAGPTRAAENPPELRGSFSYSFTGAETPCANCTDKIQYEQQFGGELNLKRLDPEFYVGTFKYRGYKKESHRMFMSRGGPCEMSVRAELSAEAEVEASLTILPDGRYYLVANYPEDEKEFTSQSNCGQAHHYAGFSINLAPYTLREMLEGVPVSSPGNQ